MFTLIKQNFIQFSKHFFTFPKILISEFPCILVHVKKNIYVVIWKCSIIHHNGLLNSNPTFHSASEETRKQWMSHLLSNTWALHRHDKAPSTKGPPDNDRHGNRPATSWRNKDMIYKQLH